MKRRSMMKRLLSRKTKTVAFGHSVHFLPALVGDRPCDLPRDPFKVAFRRGFRHLTQSRLSGLDLSLETSIDRVRGGNKNLRRRLDYRDRSSAFRNCDSFTRLDPPKNAGGLVLQFAHAHLRFVGHVATNVATTFPLRQSSLTGSRLLDYRGTKRLFQADRSRGSVRSIERDTGAIASRQDIVLRRAMMPTNPVRNNSTRFIGAVAAIMLVLTIAVVPCARRRKTFCSIRI